MLLIQSDSLPNTTTKEALIHNSKCLVSIIGMSLVFRSSMLTLFTVYHHCAFAGKQSSKTYNVYPRDRVFAAGSTATFCCILPAGEHFDKMYLTGYDGTNIGVTNISHQIYTLTVNLTDASAGCIQVNCKTNTNHYGACTFVGGKYCIS